MREILFKAKVKETGEWVEGFYAVKGEAYRQPEQHCICVSTLSGNCESSYFTDVEVWPETVGQYTGLEDVNGKKIFEGDIVRDLRLYLCHEREFEQGYINEEKYEAYRKNARTNVVSFCDVGSCGCCYEAFVGSGFAAFGIDLNECEVIGNIHDNPELLKGGELDES